MQNYTEQARKNGYDLSDQGPCQFCGAALNRGVHECVEMFNLGFDVIDYSDTKNHLYRFMCVDAHTLQHPEIHGRWNNHFHLTRLHLIFKYKVRWNYSLSPKLSDCLNKYKSEFNEEILTPPNVGSRGDINVQMVSQHTTNLKECQEWIQRWANLVYDSWQAHHHVADKIANRFL